MPDKTWKRFERKVGELIGLPKGRQREGPTGVSGLDCQTADLGVQCKYREVLPPLLVDALENAEMCARPCNAIDMDVGQDAVAVFTQKGWSPDQYIVALRFVDYLELRDRASLYALAKDGDLL